MDHLNFQDPLNPREALYGGALKPLDCFVPRET